MPPVSQQPKKPVRRAHTTPTPQLLTDALESLGDGVLLLANKPGRGGLTIVHANAAFERMSGRTAGSLVGRRQNLLHVENEALTKLRRWLKTATPGDTHQGEGQLKHLDGSTLYASWTIALVPPARGASASLLVATYRDLTAQKQVQQAWLHSQRLEAVERLAGGLAHDFNNLLPVINGYCEILADMPDVQRIAGRQLGEIHQAGQKATNLVRSLLAFSRLQVLSPHTIRIDQLVQDNADTLGRLLGPDKHLQLELTAGAANIRFDPAQLQQVLHNLILNARDALAPGGRVTIGTALRQPLRGHAPTNDDDPRETCVELTLTDNGSGMDAATRDHLFEPFYTTKDEGQGTGLGLALVYGIMQQSEGHISVRSEPGVGTTFTLRFPPVPGKATPLSGSLSTPASTQGRETVLLIEEDEVVRKMLAGILTADGYTVHHAGTPTAAASLTAQPLSSIDLVIIDPGAHQAEAHALLDQLHSARPDIRVLCTASTATMSFPQLPASSKTELAKPYALNALLQAARKLLDARG